MPTLQCIHVGRANRVFSVDIDAAASLVELKTRTCPCIARHFQVEAHQIDVHLARQEDKQWLKQDDTIVQELVQGKSDDWVVRDMTRARPLEATTTLSEWMSGMPEATSDQLHVLVTIVGFVPCTHLCMDRSRHV
ncbi:hypothetical protein Poli38472_007026 [Pythium oligandrum]|uniref:Crinkler effector protein N-terminal domain-containing protein n=1 Tax=Pythium oligandrum TaxID=41045 RepID=A0A8K1C8Y9_PYTOL|nr:hypothetical protein Poli38472_007026 [Pythium oligandrum]|eukprot:TMW58881.1 hypothetical protein Poli38472_007026 [Pythium oligandrum]